jgi:cobaltochelatase CobT
MRGEKIVALATSALLLLELLEKWHIRAEVLGFTTRAWKGGQTRELWLSDGKPVSPGRLNDLRHIIYKTFGQTASESSRSLGLMLREGLLKENIDGEALLWAYSRLTQEQSKTKILFMFSDGPPVDDSTISVQGKEFLNYHLNSVVHQIMAEKQILLQIIGIDHSLPNLFANTITVTDRKLARPVLNTVRAVIAEDG